MIEKAYDFAREKHKTQLDDCGLPYFEAHCCQVYRIIKDVTTDENIICAALLHDTIEDTDTTYEELVEEFNKTVADLVMEVTHEGSKDDFGYYFPRLKSKDAILIKFADRLSNLSRIEEWDDTRQKQYLKRSKFWKSERKKGEE